MQPFERLVQIDRQHIRARLGAGRDNGGWLLPNGSTLAAAHGDSSARMLVTHDDLLTQKSEYKIVQSHHYHMQTPRKRAPERVGPF